MCHLLSAMMVLVTMVSTYLSYRANTEKVPYNEKTFISGMVTIDEDGKVTDDLATREKQGELKKRAVRWSLLLGIPLSIISFFFLC